MLPNQNLVLNPALEIELLRNVCSNSFYRFVQEFWHLVSTEQFKPSWYVQYLCQVMQDTFDDVAAGRPKKHDIIINIPPSLGKSTVCSILLPAWIHCRMPTCRFITASFDYDLATTFSIKSKAVMQSDLYTKCYGKFRFTPERMGHYTNQFLGERMVFSTGQAPTGQHAHFILIDDPVNPLAADRDVQIHSTNMWMHRVLRSRTVDARVTPFILIMQRLSENDPTGDWLLKVKDNAEKIKHIRLPASIEKGQVVSPRGLKKYYQNNLLDPVRLSNDVLADTKLYMATADYSAQYDQEPLPSEGLLFKVQNLICRALDPLDPVIAKVRCWDKAISTNINACYTAGCLMGRTAGGKYVVLDMVRGQWGAADREAIILNTAKADGLDTIIGVEMEPGSGGMESAMYTVRNLAGFKVFVDKVQTSKIARAEAYAIQVEHGNCYLQEGSWNSAFLSEIASFPRGRYKDQVDSAVFAFNTLAGARQRTAGAI